MVTKEIWPVPVPLVNVTEPPALAAALYSWAVHVVVLPTVTPEGEQESVRVGDALFTVMD